MQYRIVGICGAYENGIGQGMRYGECDKLRLSNAYSDPDCREAYLIGFDRSYSNKTPEIYFDSISEALTALIGLDIILYKSGMFHGSQYGYDCFVAKYKKGNENETK